MKDVVVLVPTLGRPHHIEPLLNSLYATTDRASVLFLTTRGDHDAVQAIKKAGERHMNVEKRKLGDYARKINAGYKATDEPYMFLAATDLIFHDDWLDNALNKMTRTVQVVGTNDLGNIRVIRGEHSTHTMVSRYYCDTFGTVDERNHVLYEGYPHEYVDDEFVQTAKCRDAFDMAMDSVVEHIHPAWGKAKWDASYKAVDKRLEDGYRIYRRRRKLWMQL